MKRKRGKEREAFIPFPFYSINDPLKLGLWYFDSTWVCWHCKGPVDDIQPFHYSPPKTKLRFHLHSYHSLFLFICPRWGPVGRGGDINPNFFISIYTKPILPTSYYESFQKFIFCDYRLYTYFYYGFFQFYFTGGDGWGRAENS